MAYVVFNLLAAAALIGIDQAIKLWATNVLQPIGAMPLIPHVVELRFVLNPGMAFSLLSGKQLFLIIATSIALILVAYGLFFRSRGRYLQQAALLLILAGGIGNLIDRVLNGVVAPSPFSPVPAPPHYFQVPDLRWSCNNTTARCAAEYCSAHSTLLYNVRC